MANVCMRACLPLVRLPTGSAQVMLLGLCSDAVAPEQRRARLADIEDIAQASPGVTPRAEVTPKEAFLQ